MAQETSGSVENWRARVEKALQEKNPFTDILQKVEEKTGVKRLYLVAGIVIKFNGFYKSNPSRLQS